MAVIHLAAVPTNELRAELHRRDEIAAEERSRQVRETLDREFGVCVQEPSGLFFTKIDSGGELQVGPCGKRFSTYESRMAEEILGCPDGWPVEVPCPPERAIRLGAIWDIHLGCERGHTTTKRVTRFYEKPIPPLF